MDDILCITYITYIKFKKKSNQRLNHLSSSLDSNHTGEEVALYANGGPFSSLYNGIHEQNYVAHVISFSTCIGMYKDEKHCAVSS